MIDIEQIESEFKAYFGDKENEHTLLARMHPLIEEVKRLRKMLLTNDICPTCGYYTDKDFSLDCCKTWGLGE